MVDKPDIDIGRWRQSNHLRIDWNLIFELNLTLKVNIISQPIAIVTKLFCTSDPNLVILVWTCDK